jgi:hypothetical protein
MTSSGIELATFHLVAYCLDQLRYCVPPRLLKPLLKFIFNPDLFTQAFRAVWEKAVIVPALERKQGLC